mgnify:CR=1 FL=1
MESTAWQGKFIKVTTEVINDIEWERTYIPHGVVIFPVTAEGKFIVIKERRLHETPPIRLKMVTGMLDAGSDPAENANRELQEEIGLKAGKLIPFWQHRSSGTVNSVTHFFLAKNLIKNKLPNPDGEDVIEEVLELSLDELRQKVDLEEMRWGVGVMGFLRLDQFIRQGKLSLT